MKLDRKNIDFKYNLKEYWSLLRKHQVTLYFVLFVILIVEATQVADNLIFKFLIDRGTEFAGGTLARSPFVQALVMLLIIYLSIVILRAVGKFLFIHLINRLDAKLIVDLKEKYFNHIIGLSHNFHTTHKTGSLISRLVRGGSAMESMTDVLVFNAAPLVFRLIVTLGILYFYSAPSGFIVLATIMLYLGYSLFLQRKQEPYSIERNEAEDREKAAVSDFLMNVDSIKYFGKEKIIQKKFSAYVEHSRKAMLSMWDFFRYMDFGQNLILALGTVGLMTHAILGFLNGSISIGSVVFIFTTFLSLKGPLFGFLHGIRQFYETMADFEVLFQYSKIENEVKDMPHAKPHKIRSGRINFKDVGFSYGKRKIFNKLNLEIGAHKKVAFVGHSGCGKTTLVKLLYRLYDINKGSIAIDGKDLTSFTKESLRKEMSIVPQECALFDDTIYNNIKFSKPNATRKEVFKAIKFAQLDKIIAYFPEREQTIVGERGVKLSGGEKQRVSIARAILANKRVLVLDEATSALDSQTEHEIQRDLEKLMKGRTSIIIAHRLSTIMAADTIVVMHRGKIIQMGTHKQLVKKKGQYQKLWHFQKGGYIK